MICKLFCTSTTCRNMAKQNMARYVSICSTYIISTDISMSWKGLALNSSSCNVGILEIFGNTHMIMGIIFNIQRRPVLIRNTVSGIHLTLNWHVGRGTSVGRIFGAPQLCHRFDLCVELDTLETMRNRLGKLHYSRIFL